MEIRFGSREPAVKDNSHVPEKTHLIGPHAEDCFEFRGKASAIHPALFAVDQHQGHCEQAGAKQSES